MPFCWKSTEILFRHNGTAGDSTTLGRFVRKSGSRLRSGPQHRVKNGICRMLSPSPVVSKHASSPCTL